MELRDAYDSSFKKIEGKTLVRGEPFPPGVFHLGIKRSVSTRDSLVCDVLVEHTDGTYLLMKRDP